MKKKGQCALSSKRSSENKEKYVKKGNGDVYRKPVFDIYLTLLFTIIITVTIYIIYFTICIVYIINKEKWERKKK